MLSESEILEMKRDARIAELEEVLRGFKDQPHACIDRDSAVTLLECPICILKISARKVLDAD